MGVGDVERRINRLLDRAEKREVFPVVSLELHKAIQADRATTFRLEKLLFADTSLGLAIVERASQLTGNEWSSMRHLPIAIETVGLHRLNSIVMAIEVAKRTISGRESLRPLWAHALRTGFFARAIAAKTLAVPEEDAFVGGVIHDFGVILMRAVGGSSYARLLNRCGLTLVGLNALERDRYGFDHGEVAHMQLGRWGGSNVLLEGVYSHHEENPSALGALIQVADNIDVLSGLSMPVEVIASSTAEIAIARRIGLSEVNYVEVIKSALASANEMMSIVSKMK